MSFVASKFDLPRRAKARRYSLGNLRTLRVSKYFTQSSQSSLVSQSLRIFSIAESSLVRASAPMSELIYMPLVTKACA